MPKPGELVSILLVGGVDQTPVRQDRPDLSNRQIALKRAKAVEHCLRDTYRTLYQVELAENAITLSATGPSNVGQRVPESALAEDRRVAVFGQVKVADALGVADQIRQLPEVPEG